MLTKIRILWLKLKIARLERDIERMPFVRPIIEDMIEAIGLEIFRLEHSTSTSGMQKAVVVMLMFALLGVIATMVMNQLVGP